MVELVVKANGSTEPYSRSKLFLSVARCGVPVEDAIKLTEEIETVLPSIVSSDEIYAKLLSRLRERYPQCAIKYAIRRAMMRLGPEGYPFERFIARLLEKMGYVARTNVRTRGKCIEHELDVVAEGWGRRFFVECKYHNTPGIKVDAKVALYVYARYLDLRDKFDEAWIVTNTKVTTEAAAYAKCVDLRVLAWHYPEEGLEALIERYNLYPITVLATLTEDQRRSLFARGVVTLDDLAKLDENQLAEAADISWEQARITLSEARLMAHLRL